MSLQGQADATWVFMAWEGVMAKQKQIALNAFSMETYGIPYGYSPVLVTTPQVLRCGCSTPWYLVLVLDFHPKAVQPGTQVGVVVPGNILTWTPGSNHDWLFNLPADGVCRMCRSHKLYDDIGK